MIKKIKNKKTKNIEPIKNRNNALSYSQFKDLVNGFTDEEINRFYDLLASLQQKP